jgi:uncharacterized membrane protein
MSDQGRAAPDAPARTADLGVLFVHGIGEQEQADTLTRCSEPLYHALDRWAASADPAGTVVIERANLTGGDAGPQPDGASGGPAPASLDLTISGHPDSGQPTHRWLLAESWWAADFVSPKFGQLFTWSLLLTYRAARQLLVPLKRDIRAGAASFARTDIPGTAAVIWGGFRDSVTESDSGTGSGPEPGSAIYPDRTEFISANERAGPDDEEVKAGEDKLAAIRAGGYQPTINEEDLREEFYLDLGGGRDSLGSTLAGLGLDLAFGPAAMLYGIAFIGLVVFVVVAFSSLVPLLVPGLVGAAVAGVAIISLLLRIFGYLPRIGSRARAIQTALAASVGDSYVWQRSPVRRAALISQVEADLTWLSSRCNRVAIVAHSQGTAITYELLARRQPPDNLVLFVTYGTAIRLLNQAQREIQADPKVSPEISADGDSPEAAAGDDFRLPGLGTSFQWLDFAATLDPVAVRPLTPIAGRQGFRVHNDRSLFRDHSAYWENTEEFVVRLMLALIGAEASSPRLRRDADEQLLADATGRRVRRGAILGLAAVGAVALAAIPPLLLTTKAAGQSVNRGWRDIGTIAAKFPGFPSGLRSAPSWGTGGAGGLVIFALATMVLAVVLMGLVRAIWRRWDETERKRMLDRQLADKTSWAGRAVMAAALVAPVALSAIALFGHSVLRIGGGVFGIAWFAGVVLFVLVLTAYDLVGPKSEQEIRRSADAERKAKAQRLVDQRRARGKERYDSWSKDEQDRRFKAAVPGLISKLQWLNEAGRSP